MYNLLIQLIIYLLIFCLCSFLFKANENRVWYFIVGSIIFILYTLSNYPNYKLIKYIKTNYNDFYRKHSDRMGTKFWLVNMKSDLESLKDEYINKFIKHL